MASVPRFFRYGASISTITELLPDMCSLQTTLTSVVVLGGIATASLLSYAIVEKMYAPSISELAATRVLALFHGSFVLLQFGLSTAAAGSSPDC
jgi:hypothetical protein